MQVGRLAVVLCLLTLPLSVLSGCGPRPDKASDVSGRLRSAPPVPFSSVDPLSAVRQSALYVEARQDCRAKHYAQAAVLLDRLSSSPGLTLDQVAFCRDQRAICLRDAGKPVPAPRPTASAAAPPNTPLTPEQADCGPRALALACERLGVVKGADVASLRRAAGTTGKGTTLAGLALAAQSVGLKAKGEQVDLPALKRLSGPAIAWVDGNHYLTVLSVDGDTATIHDPNHKGEEETPTAALLARSGGVLLALGR